MQTVSSILLSAFKTLVVLCLFIATPACQSSNDDLLDSGDNNFTRGQSWLYQLQSADIDAVKNSGFTWVVMDYSLNGEQNGEYAPAQIRGLVDAGITPIAYISIGEAENYRFYWNTAWVGAPNSNEFTSEAPSWLGHTNPDWIGNYKVRYWDNDWRDNYLNPYLDRILAQGFRGVYLDIIDAFEYWADSASYGSGPNQETFLPGDPRGDEALAGRRMIGLVEWIASYARSHSSFGGGFLIFPQNGERILNYDDDGAYMQTVSGIGREDIWYNETRQNPADEIDQTLAYLRQFTAEGKTVLAVDYLDNGSGFSGANRDRILNFARKCNAEGFRYYIARSDRELDRVNSITGVQP